MKKLLIILNFIVLSFIFLTPTPVRADNITYYSSEGKIINYSEYKEACKKKAEELVTLKEMAKKIEIRKSEIYKNPTLSKTVQLNTDEKSKLNIKSSRKKCHSRAKDKYLNRKKLEQEKQLLQMERERLKRKFVSEIPGLVYHTDPIAKPSTPKKRQENKTQAENEIAMIERELEAERIQSEIIQREKSARIKRIGKCPPSLAKIYNNRSGQVRCVHRVIANRETENDYDIEIIEE
jgi:hypothetical protein